MNNQNNGRNDPQEFHICPMHLFEIECRTMEAFEFKMPTCEVGHNDVLIHIEYNHTYSDENLLVYNVWVQLDGSTTRFFLYSGSIPGFNKGDPVQSIVSQLNESNDFIKLFHIAVGFFCNHSKIN